jgi:hypothetical protein
MIPGHGLDTILALDLFFHLQNSTIYLVHFKQWYLQVLKQIRSQFELGLICYWTMCTSTVRRIPYTVLPFAYLDNADYVAFRDPDRVENIPLFKFLQVRFRWKIKSRVTVGWTRLLISATTEVICRGVYHRRALNVAGGNLPIRRHDFN